MKLRLGMSREMINDDGTYPEHIRNLPIISDSRVIFEPFPRKVGVIPAEFLRGCDCCLGGSALFDTTTLQDVGGFCAIARWGVGYDNVDPAACTAADVALLTTRGALDASVAESALSYILILSHRMLLKDKHARAGIWNQRLNTLGNELREKTIGIVGLGGIGAALVKLLAPFGTARILVFDPFLQENKARELGVEKSDLATLLKASDIVTIHCPKTPETTNLIDAAALKLMKRSAYLVNTARGGIVNQKALFEALRDGVIRGAGIDVFEQEPPPADEPLLTLDNVVLSPHANSLTQESMRDIGLHITRNLLKLTTGEMPEFIINKEVTTRPGFLKKLADLKRRFS
jgi:phosphoglycerate dehydrogenase-like enzyme